MHVILEGIKCAYLDFKLLPSLFLEALYEDFSVVCAIESKRYKHIPTVLSKGTGCGYIKLH